MLLLFDYFQKSLESTQVKLDKPISIIGFYSPPLNPSKKDENEETLKTENENEEINKEEEDAEEDGDDDDEGYY